MPRRGIRTRVERGIYRDGTGYAVIATVRRTQREQRWPLDTKLATLRVALAALTAALDADLRQHAAPAAGTVTADIRAYLATLPAGRMKADTTTLLEHWRVAIGDRARLDLQPSDLRTVMSAWLDAGLAAETVNRRRGALVAMWNALHGKAAANPARDTRKLPAAVHVRDVRADAIRLILEHLPTRTAAGRYWKAPAHLRVLAATGWPPAIIRALTPDSLAYLDARPPFVVVPGRKKGAGTAAEAVPVTPDAVDALRQFHQAGAYGNVSRNTMRRVFLGAVAKARRQWEAEQRGPWPVSPQVSPYWLRHAYGNRAARATRGSLPGVQRLMLHKSATTTMRYLRASVDPLAQAAVDALSADLHGPVSGTVKKPEGNG